MKNAKSILFLSLIGFMPNILLAGAAPTKGSSMITKTLQPGQKLDLSTFTTSRTGISYKIITPGKPDQKVPSGKQAVVHYSGWLLKDKDIVGAPFDSSVDRNSPFEFPLGMGHVIKGWDLSVADMNIGEKRIIILPPNLAYGSRAVGGVIPANASLIFEIDVLGFR